MPKRSSLRSQAARQYYRQVVDGVTFCHDHLVAHRDLKSVAFVNFEHLSEA